MGKKKAKKTTPMQPVTEKNISVAGAKKSLPFWGKALITLAVVGVCGLILTVILFNKDRNPSFATAKLQLSFDGAASGVGPDGYDFDLRELTADDILSKGLKNAGLDSRYTVDDVRKSLVVSGVYPNDMVGETMSYDSLLNFTASRTLTIDRFHPTTFEVKLYDTALKSISKAEQEKLLNEILSAFKTNFAVVHAEGVPSLGSEFTLSDYDYPQQMTIIEEQLSAMAGYASEMYEKDPSFRYNNRGFNDVSVEVAKLLESDVERLNANITLNALTKDPERLLVQYEFEIRDMTSRLANQKKQQANLDALIERYMKSDIVYIGAGDTVTRIDGNSSETYDALVDLRKEVAAKNTELSSKIAITKHKVDDILQQYKKGTTEDDETDADAGDGNTNADNKVNANNGAATGNKANANNNAANANTDGDTPDDTPSLTPEQIAEIAKQEEAEMQKKREAFEKEVVNLTAKRDKIMAGFAEMVKAWNDSRINDLTVSVSPSTYKGQSIISGAFVKKGIMTAGPFCMLALMGILVVVIVRNSRKAKEF
ncbi:MAG: hypothetical protein K6F11_06390 [Lachnospiraceae bacterium]|nr:hypothetical protein [Lachnospiraceae bacterium]